MYVCLFVCVFMSFVCLKFIVVGLKFIVFPPHDEDGELKMYKQCKESTSTSLIWATLRQKY